MVGITRFLAVPVLQPPDCPGKPLVPGLTQAGVDRLWRWDEIESFV